MKIEFRITITDEYGNEVCKDVPIEEEQLEAISKAAGGLGDFINNYYKNIEGKLSGDYCEECRRNFS